ncbi:MAG: hypothetical protein ACI8W7_000102 [Gammaproteobacteria bacterium]|jgi:hypothetical protein
MAENPYATPDAEITATASDAPRMWNPNGAGNWSLLFTPVFGSFLVWKNWQAIGEPSRGLGWFICCLVMLIPTVLLPGAGILYLIMWYFGSAKKQARFIEERWGKQYPRRSWTKPLLCGVAAYAVVFGSLVLVAEFLG